MAFLLVIALLCLFVWVALKLWHRMIHAEFVYRLTLKESLSMMLKGVPPISILKAKDLADAHQISVSTTTLQATYLSGINPFRVIELMVADPSLNYETACKHLAK